MGPTSGAAWLVAQWKARLEPDARVVVLLPDEGHRYQNTVYDDTWLRRQGLRLRRIPSRPVEVDTPEDGRTEWSWLRWNRRPLDAVVPKGAAA
jgi:cysteine synthase A